jgi:hypothetical protein
MVAGKAGISCEVLDREGYLRHGFLPKLFASLFRSPRTCFIPPEPVPAHRDVTNRYPSSLTV